MGDLKGKKVTVVGLGKSGLAAAEFLKKLGANVRVTETKKNIEVESRAQRLKAANIGVELGRHSQGFIENTDLIVASPGVTSDSITLLWAKRAEIPIVGELELATEFAPCPIIAVTGTNGKTTTVTLLGEILKGTRQVEVAGNIGRPVSEVVSRLTEKHLLILEVSSFQLERIKKFRPQISIILNITPDHLDRYQSFEDYLSAKKRIFLNQKPDDYAIFPADTPFTKSLEEEIECRQILFGRQKRLQQTKKGIFYQGGSIYSNFSTQEEKILDLGNLKLAGSHNLDNIMACLAVTTILGEDSGRVGKAIKDFSGLEHRLEVAGKFKDVVFINDSKSTNVDSLIKAIQSFSPIILIAGGRDKGADFSQARGEIKKRVKEIILLGEAKEKLKECWRNTKPIHWVEDLEEAIILSLKLSRAGDFVLFSPGCSSFDMFKNFEERGKVFKETVAKLKYPRLAGYRVGGLAGKEIKL